MAFERQGLSRIGGAGTGGTLWMYNASEALTMLLAQSCNLLATLMKLQMFYKRVIRSMLPAK